LAYSGSDLTLRSVPRAQLPRICSLHISAAVRLADCDFMTLSDLQDLIVFKLVREAGDTRSRWRIVLGPFRIYDKTTHPQCNWAVMPTGSAREVVVVERLLDDVRMEHSLVTPD